MNTNLLLLPSSPLLTLHSSPRLQNPNPVLFFPSTRHRRRPLLLRAVSGDNGGNGSNEPNTESSPPPPPPPPPRAPRLNIKSRVRSRNQAKRLKELGGGGGAVLPARTTKKKEWAEMTVAEKASEIYVGEKGLLFWLNKFAYASIFIVVGGWILFRFVGPLLGLYELESPPLPPTSMLNGSP